MTRRHVRPGDRNPHQHGFQLAERIVEAWHGSRTSDELAVPLSAITAMALVNPNGHTPNELAEAVFETTPEQLADFIRGVWRTFARVRPDLLNPVWPLMGVWMSDEHPLNADRMKEAHRAVLTAAQYDLFGITGTDKRFDTDVLGALLTMLRPKSALQGRGQFYTPAPVAEHMAEMLMGEVHVGITAAGLPLNEGESICEPACGTGGMLRAMAQVIRGRGGDPTRYSWYAVDIDPLAIACLAVNVQLWGLGANVLLGCEDVLAHSDWDVRAAQLRRETVELAERLEFSAEMARRIALMERVLRGEPDPELEPEPEPDLESESGSEPEPEPGPTPFAVDGSGQAFLLVC